MISDKSPRATAEGQLVADVVESGGFRGLRLLVVLLCMLFNMLDGFDITAMAVVARDVGVDLRLGDDLVGWLFGFATAGMMAGAMLLAPLADIVGRRRLIVFSLALVGVSVLATAAAGSFYEFALLRFLAGAGAGAMLASQATLAAEYSPERYRAMSVALVTSGYPAGAMLTSVAAEFILPLCGWRVMFLFGGAVTLVMSLLAFLLIPESLKFLLERRPADALARVNHVLKRLGHPALAELPPAADIRRRGGLFDSIASLLAAPLRRQTVALWSAFFLSFAALYFLLSWTPKLVEDAGAGAAAGRTAFFLFNLGGVLGIYLLAAWSVRARVSLVAGGMLAAAAAVMLCIALLPAGPSLFLVPMFAVGLLLQGGFTGLYGVAAKIYPTAIRGTGVGWAIGLGRSGAVFGPVTAGYLIEAEFGLTVNFVFFAVPLAVSAVLALGLKVR